MKIKINRTITTLLTTLLLLGVQSAHGALISYTITGDVVLGGDNAGPNAFSLDSGDTITATGIFDDSVLISGSGEIDFSLGTGNTMTLSVGTQTLTASDDNDFAAGGGPTITLNSLSLTDFDFTSAAAGFNSNFTYFDDFGNLFGDWRTDIDVSVVPVPAAVWLFGSGLLGLVGVARRRA